MVTVKYDLNELTENIKQWFRDRDLDKSNPKDQMLKLMEEFGELVDGLEKDDQELITDSMGDVYVVLVGLTLQTGIDFNKAVSESVKEISHLVDSTPKELLLEMMKKIGKLAEGLAKNKEEVTKDSIGNIYVVLNILSSRIKIGLDVAINTAYQEIKDRKGKKVNGVFIKEEDLQ